MGIWAPSKAAWFLVKSKTKRIARQTWERLGERQNMLEKLEGPRLVKVRSPPQWDGGWGHDLRAGLVVSQEGRPRSQSPTAPRCCCTREAPWVGQRARPAFSWQVFTEHLLGAGAVLGAGGIYVLVREMEK